MALLMAWMQLCSEYDTCDEHNALFACSLEQTKAARQSLKNEAGSEILFAAERGKLPSEDSEPEEEP